MNSSGKPTKLQPLITFYPASVSFAEAEAIKLDAGSERAGVDIRILRGPTLSVKGRIAGITDSATKYLVSAHEEGRSQGSRRQKFFREVNLSSRSSRRERTNSI